MAVYVELGASRWIRFCINFSFSAQKPRIACWYSSNSVVLVVALSMFLTPGLFILFDKVILPSLRAKFNDREADTISSSARWSLLVLADSVKSLTDWCRMMSIPGFWITKPPSRFVTAHQYQILFWWCNSSWLIAYSRNRRSGNALLSPYR